VRARKRNNTPFYIGVAAVAVAGLATISYLATRPKQEVRTVDPSLPPVQAEGYLMGSATAPVQIIEFADFECPSCGNFATITEPDVRKRIIAPGLASIRYFDFPLPMHRNTWAASNAAACASDQGKFWEMHDRLFQGQDQWNGEATGRPKGVFKDYAKELGLNVDQWEDCFDSKKHQPRIQANAQEAERRKVSMTPTFIIGDKVIPGAVAYDEFKKYVDEAAKAKAATPAADSVKKPAAAATRKPGGR
jgi:protein-disulfide isomerase